MDLKQIIYSSQPFGYDDAALSGILLDARLCNLRDQVTGALICRRDIYLQLLEGPADKIDATLERIKGDDRHLEVTLRCSRTVAGRMFGDWAMLHDPAVSWLWPMEEVSKGVLDTLSEEDFVAVFQRLAAQKVVS